MANIKITPLNIELTASVDSNLMEFLTLNGINLKNNCGFRGSCKKCTVKLLSGNLNNDAHYIDNIYLACQSKISEDIEIELIEYSLDKAFKINKKFDFHSSLTCLQMEKININVLPPSKEDKTADFERVMALFPDYSIAGVEVLKKLPFALRENNWNISVIKDNFKKLIVDIDKPSDKQILGLAVDIGTTTVNIIITDLTNGKIIDSASSYNEQISFGTDVISRIIYSQREKGIETLKAAVVSTINKLIDDICQNNNLIPSNIYQAVFAGNTTMMHILLGIVPNFLRIEPYVPAFFNYSPVANEIGININKYASIYCYESFGSYVGGDISAGILASRMYKNDEISLLIDIGTNGEIVLGNADWLISCACSAGPAFEGAGVKNGSRAINGAIDSVKINNKSLEPEITVINKQKPIGICGSGMIDAIAELFKAGIIDRQGKFIKNSERIKDKSYILVNIGEIDSDKEIVISESDIQNIVRTKGAIFAGIYSLLEYAGITLDEISKIYVAGGLGESIDFKNAVAIGLFPDIDRNKYEYLGNTSLKGCYLRLINYKEEQDIKKISEIMNYFDISEDEEYMNRFISSLFIPHTDLSLFPNIFK